MIHSIHSIHSINDGAKTEELLSKREVEEFIRERIRDVYWDFDKPYHHNERVKELKYMLRVMLGVSDI